MLAAIALLWRHSLLDSTFNAPLRSGFFWRITRLSWPLVALIGAIPFALYLVFGHRKGTRFAAALLVSALMFAGVPLATYYATRPASASASNDRVPTDAPLDLSSAPPAIPTAVPASPSAAPSAVESGGTTVFAPAPRARPAPVGSSSSSSSQSHGGSGSQSQHQ